MSRICVGIFVTAGLLFGAISAQAIETGEPGRYTMQQTDSGFLRLDTQTGAVSLCASEANAWSCRAIDDDGRALQNENAELLRKNNVLKAEVERLKGELRVAEDRGPTAGFSSGGGIPSEQEIDKAFTFVERILKRFKGLVEDLRDEKPNGTQL